MTGRCPECGAGTAREVTETFDGDRLGWAVSTRCGGCGGVTERCGWDEMPDDVRRILVAQVGLVRLRVDPVAARPIRVRLLGVFRRQGATIAEASSTFAALTSGGILGTPAETRLLARRLTAVGAIVSLDPQPGRRSVGGTPGTPGPTPRGGPLAPDGRG